MTNATPATRHRPSQRSPKRQCAQSRRVRARRYEYAPYGERTVYTSPGSNDPDCHAPTLLPQRVNVAGSTQPYAICDVGFQGKQHDDATGLIGYQYRIWHPRFGSWIQNDPLGTPDGQNRRAGYHVMWGGLDPTGLKGWDDWLDPEWLLYYSGAVLCDLGGRAAATAPQAWDGAKVLVTDPVFAATATGQGLVDARAGAIDDAANVAARAMAAGKSDLAVAGETAGYVLNKIVGTENIVEGATGIEINDAKVIDDNLVRGQKFFFGVSQTAAVIAAAGGTAIKDLSARLSNGGSRLMQNLRRAAVIEQQAAPKPPCPCPEGPVTWKNPKTLADHFARHGKDFGSGSAQEYAQRASDFLRNSQSQRLPTKIGPDGTIRVYDPKTNTFGSYTPAGETRTFYTPDPILHKYPTNLDYWNAQPGTSPWTP